MFPQVKKNTLQDLLNLPTGQKAELVDGSIVMMVASALHSLLQASLANIAISAFQQKIFKVAKPKSKEPSGFWVLTEAATFYNQHNVFVHDIAAFDKQRLPSLSKEMIKVTPFWVCEVLSPSNWINDTQRKRLILEEFGVPFYWIVDPERKSIQVFQQKSKGEHYQILDCVTSESGSLCLEPFKDYEINLVELFNY